MIRRLKMIWSGPSIGSIGIALEKGRARCALGYEKIHNLRRDGL